MAATAVTPVGVRDGDPDALAGLCDRRGPAVLAYCEVVAGRGEAGVAAAAEAFASFRLGVVAAPDLANLNPEALLISATRHAAARIAGLDAPAAHADVPPLLAARADRSITLAEHDWLEEHLASCWTCRAPVARFDAADRAYRDPPRTPLAPEVSAAIVAAMAAAAPVRGAEIEPPAAEVNVNGSVAHAGVPEAEPYRAGEPELEPAEYVEQPTAAWQVGDDDLDLARPGRIEDDEEDDAAAARRERRSASRESRRGITRRPRAERSGKQRGTSGAGRAAPKAGAARAARSARPSRAERIAAAPAAAAAAAAAEAEGEGAEASERSRGSGRGTSMPRPRRTVGSAAGSRRSRSGPRAGVVLPIALVVLAIIVALLIAGVFGGGEPESSPQSFAPVPAESGGADAPVVVVPGAASAGAAAVERAKAKARAAKRRAAEQRASGEATAADSPTALPTPATTPPPATTAGDGDDTTAAPVDAEDTGSGGATPKIDAGKDATGAEQVPGTPDTSTVPELAPPAESADPPPG